MPYSNGYNNRVDDPHQLWKYERDRLHRMGHTKADLYDAFGFQMSEYLWAGASHPPTFSYTDPDTGVQIYTVWVGLNTMPEATKPCPYVTIIIGGHYDQTVLRSSAHRFHETHRWVIDCIKGED